jgi:hypothetical protein
MPVTVELSCEGRELRAVSIGHRHDGYVFRCTIGPITDEVFGTLAAAARLDGTVRLVFPEHPLVLERVEIHRIELRYVQIFGRVVGAAR